MSDNLDFYGGMNLYRAPQVPERVKRQIKEIVQRAGASPIRTEPWPPRVRRVLQREYTR